MIKRALEWIDNKYDNPLFGLPITVAFVAAILVLAFLVFVPFCWFCRWWIALWGFP